MNNLREYSIARARRLVLDWGFRILKPAKSKWMTRVRSEMDFWDAYLETKGLQWADEYNDRINPDFPMQPYVLELLPPESDVHVLDVGAGPLTYLGKKAPGKRIRITAVDALAYEYDELLRKHGVDPPVRTQRLDAEGLTRRFSANTFDLGVARNCLDHAYKPERAVLQMLAVVKRGRYVLLEHFRNEAETQNYAGLHQWNFDVSADGDFLIRSKSDVVNMTQKYARRCTISVKLNTGNGMQWLFIRILKK